MVERLSGVKASVGFASETGPRERNEDFAGAVFGSELPKPRRDVVAAIADGIGGAKGGRVAAETAVRGFLDGFCDLPETMEVRRAAASDRQLAQWLDQFPGPARPRAGGHGMHLHRAGAARPRRPCAACRRHARLSAARRPPHLPDHRPCARGWHRPLEHPQPRARRRDGGAARLRHPAGGAARPLPAVQRRRARHAHAPTPSPTSCASAPRPTIRRARWSRPRSMPAAPTTARPWCSTWSSCRRRNPPISAPPSCSCR